MLQRGNRVFMPGCSMSERATRYGVRWTRCAQERRGDKLKAMADQLYLSLWFDELRFAELPARVVSVLRQFARISALPMVSAAAAIPVDFTEPPVYQRVYVLDKRAEETEDTAAAAIEPAVGEAMELLHEDTAYEFEMKWRLWVIEDGGGLDPVWKRHPATVKFTAFGPDFDEHTYEQNGHLRVDFGLDTPWTADYEAEAEEGADEHDFAGAFIDEEARIEAARHIKENVEMLLAFTLSVEKHCGISSRLLWDGVR